MLPTLKVEKIENTVVKIETTDYCITRDLQTITVIFEGVLRLNSVKEYQPLAQMLDELTTDYKGLYPDTITLNLRKLTYLNSSGISVLSKFISKLKNRKELHLLVKISQEYAWQNKVMSSLQRLMPTHMELELD